MRQQLVSTTYCKNFTKNLSHNPAETQSKRQRETQPAWQA